MPERATPPLDCERLIVLSDDDIDRVLADTYVDLREFMTDDQAAEALDVVRDRLTDRYYYG